MGIPSEHLKRLAVELSSHESWLGTLRRQIEGLEAEAAAHEMMLRLGRDRNLHRVLDELHDQPELGSRIGDDPRSFLEGRGVEVPDGAVVTVTTDSGGPLIEARFSNVYVEYGIGWSRAAGFYSIAAPSPPNRPRSETAEGEVVPGTWVPSVITVGVYEKNGLKRGRGLTDAYFNLTFSNQGWINTVAGGGPISGGSSVYEQHDCLEDRCSVPA